MGPLENDKRKILIVDDDDVCRKLVEKALESEGYATRFAQSGLEALDCIGEWQPHLVLLDVNMPGLNGLETLRNLRQREAYVSTIFVSGDCKTEDKVRGLDAGADDYICKPFSPEELLARVRTQLRIKDLNDSLKKANDRLKELVDIDDLTGLFNMRSLYKKLDFELDRARRFKRSVCVLMMDMDHFKKVNDQNDHLFGSYVLSQVGKILKGQMRKVDFAARYGGDEFLIVLTETDENGARSFAERLRQTIENAVFARDGFEVRLTASIGYSLGAGEDQEIDARSLVRYADRALYFAKERGRNRVETFDYHKDSMPSDGEKRSRFS